MIASYKKPMLKLFHYDAETTGTDSARHQIHQLAFIVEIDGEEKERVNIKMRPDPGTPVTPKALEVGGVTIEDLKVYPLSQMEGYQQLISVINRYIDRFDKTDKFHAIGFNEWFDNGFLRALFEACGDKYFGSYFWADSICVMVLASNDLKDERATLPNFKLQTIAAHYKIEPKGDWHDALTDVQVTRDIYKKRFYK